MASANDSFVKSTGGHSSASGNRDRARRLDGYHTPRVAVETLLRAERLSPRVWEPANGFSRVSRVLRESGRDVFTSDVHAWHAGTERVANFLAERRLPSRFREEGCDIVTNPPFVLAREFAEHALSLQHRGDKCCLLLRLQFIEGNKRLDLFRRGQLRRVHAYSFRLPRMHAFGYRGSKGGSAIAFAWFVFQKGYRGPTELRWIGRGD